MLRKLLLIGCLVIPSSLAVYIYLSHSFVFVSFVFLFVLHLGMKDEKERLLQYRNKQINEHLHSRVLNFF